jgi:hypothetical protein
MCAISGISVLEMRGCGRSRKESSDSIFDKDSYGLVSRLKLEIACFDELVEQVVTVLQDSAHTGLRSEDSFRLRPQPRISNTLIPDNPSILCNANMTFSNLRGFI